MGDAVAGQLGDIQLSLDLNVGPAESALSGFFNELKSDANNAGKAFGPVDTALGKLVKRAERLGYTYDKVSASFKDAFGRTQSIEKVQQRVRLLDRSLVQLRRTARKATQGIAAGFKDILTGIPQGIGLAVGQALIEPLTQLPQVAMQAAGETVAAFTDIDRALRQTISIAGADSSAFDTLSQFMLELAGTTRFTAEELSNASVQLARAGLSVDELKEALPGIAEGAAAAGESVATMSDVVVSTLGGFGLEASQTGEAVDILTAAANNSNTSVQELGEGLKYVGPIATSLGISLEETATAAGLLANSGIKASQMGTALRTGLSRLAGAANGTNSEFSQLARGTGRMSQVLTKIGSDIVDTNGDLKEMPQLLESLRSGFDNLSSTERQLAAKILFGDEAGSAWVALLNTTAEETDSFFSRINNSAGVAGETARKNLEGIAGSMALLQSAISSVQAAFGKFFTTLLKPIIDGVTALLNVFNSLPGPIQQAAIAIGVFSAAIAGAIVVIGLFKLAAFAGAFKAIGSAVAAFTPQLIALAGIIKAQVIGAFVALTTKTVALNAAIGTTTISLGAVGQVLGGLMVQSLYAVDAALGLAVKKFLLFGKALITLNFGPIIAGMKSVVTALLSGAAAAGKFLLAMAPIGFAAAAVGAVAAAFNTFYNINKEGNEIVKETRDVTNEMAKELKGIVAPLDEATEAWERKVERLGHVDAYLDIIREKLGLVTAEEQQLYDAVVKTDKAYQEFNQRIDTGISVLGQEVKKLEELEKGTRKYAEQLEYVSKIQTTLDKGISKSIQNLQARIDKTMGVRVSVDQLTEAERLLVNELQSNIDELETQKELLLETGIAAETAATAMKKAGGAVEDVKKRLTDANKELNKTKSVFEKQIAAMEEAFDNLQDKFAEELKIEIEGIEAELAELKEIESARAKAFAVEQQYRKRSLQIAKQNFDDEKRYAKDAGDAAAKAAQKELDAFKKANDETIKGREKAAEKAKEGYESAKRAQQKAHESAIKDIDAEIAAIQKRADIATSSYDTQIEALRALTPAEQKLAAIEKKRLEDAAKGTGEEALRAKAQLERMQREQQIAQVEKEREAQLAQIEREREEAEQRKRIAEEEYQNQREERELNFAQQQKQRELEIETLQAEHAKAEEERELAIAALKEETAAKIEAIEQKARNLERAFQAESFKMEQDRRREKEATAAKEKELQDQIDAKKKEGKEKEEAREEKFLARRKQIERLYQEAIGETSEYIIKQGDIAWTQYANEAVRQLKRVENAAKAAAAAATAADESSLTRQSALASNFAGGPIDAGRLTHINELGQEAFMGESGRLSLINKSPGAVWRAPEAGTIIPAHITKNLAMPTRANAHATVTRSVTTASAAHGTADRNLMRLMGAINSSNDRIVNNVSVEAPNTVQAASDLMVELTKLKRRRLG